MKAKIIGYWVATVLIGLSFLTGGVGDALRIPAVVEGMTHLGYPEHFVVVLGVWKILGAVVILAPSLLVVKEWAYAGMVFDLTGAAVAHAATGDDARHIVTPLVLTALVVASWVLRPRGRTSRRVVEAAEPRARGLAAEAL